MDGNNDYIEVNEQEGGIVNDVEDVLGFEEEEVKKEKKKKKKKKKKPALSTSNDETVISVDVAKMAAFNTAFNDVGAGGGIPRKRPGSFRKAVESVMSHSGSNSAGHTVWWS